jgi:hypothetical protein
MQAESHAVHEQEAREPPAPWAFSRRLSSRLCSVSFASVNFVFIDFFFTLVFLSEKLRFRSSRHRAEEAALAARDSLGTVVALVIVALLGEVPTARNTLLVDPEAER